MNSLFTGNLSEEAKSIVVIMAGGAGTRFWPLSRKALPKQFIMLAGQDRSLIQLTADRVTSLVQPKNILVVTAALQSGLVRSHLPEVAILSEPMPRNTAPCLAYAAAAVLKFVGDVPLLCLPADHIIAPATAAVDVYKKALSIAQQQDLLLTFGITPTRADTGYGYILAGESLANDCCCEIFRVKRFIEKPNSEKARDYFNSGGYFWNSGMFAWRPSVFLSTLEAFAPEIAEAAWQIHEVLGENGEEEKITEIFSKLSSVSVDYAVMEKAPNTAMVGGNSYCWSDVGSWESWLETSQSAGLTDSEGNLTKGDVFLDSCRNCGIISKKRFTAAIGLEDLVVIDTEDALLVCHKGSTQDVRKVVEHLKNKHREDIL